MTPPPGFRIRFNGLAALDHFNLALPNNFCAALAVGLPCRSALRFYRDSCGVVVEHVGEDTLASFDVRDLPRSNRCHGLSPDTRRSLPAR